MEFNLSEELINEIIFSMEDQTDNYILDALTVRIIKSDTIQCDENRYYNLPTWDSLQGFKMRERFILLLRNPLLRAKLRETLFSGKKVFKQFKQILKEFPEGEKLWNTFKHNELKSIVLEWYNTLREVWGLEEIGDEPEETENLVYEDFTFRDYDAQKDEYTILQATNAIIHEIEQSCEGEPGLVLASLWQNLHSLTAIDEELTIICETIAGDFAGFITVSVYPQNMQKTVILTTWYVVPNLRGFGLGKELLTLCIQALKDEEDIQYIVFANNAIPLHVSSMLIRSGFKPVGSAFIADLKN